MAMLRRALDDPELSAHWRCGRCDRCGGVTLPAAPSTADVAAARAGMDRVGVEITPRRQWPSGLETLGLDLRGRIAADEQARPGRAIARLDGLGWSGALRELFSGTDDAGAPIDGETPVALRTAAVRTLDDWDALWRPADGDDAPLPVVDAVVGIASATRPALVEHLTAGLARYLGIPALGSLSPAVGRAEPGRHDLNSAQRLAGIVRRLELPPGVAAAVADRTVLLVDDSTDSGWTLTVAARLLRRAGAAAVLPFVLAVR